VGVSEYDDDAPRLKGRDDLAITYIVGSAVTSRSPKNVRARDGHLADVRVRGEQGPWSHDEEADERLEKAERQHESDKGYDDVPSARQGVSPGPEHVRREGDSYWALATKVP
jgi:hypothetical protein